jgi:SAM-dependent methyltransferase
VTGALLKRRGHAATVVGVELGEEAADQARTRLDTVIVGDIETVELPYTPGYFDYIWCGDVIEHLIDPWRWLRRVRRYLAEDGTLIARIPNVRNWRVLVELLVHKRWTYRDAGIMDRSHLRFFTRATMIDLFRDTGFEVCRVHDLHQPSVKARIFNVLTLHACADIFSGGYCLEARPRCDAAEVGAVGG